MLGNIKLYVLFGALALLITLPWFFRPGYLFFLDWTGAPHPYIGLDATGGIAGIPIQIIWAGLGLVIGSALAQKVLITFMLVLSGSTTYRLTRFLTSNTLASIIAGIFIMTNAFVFNRIQMGHIYLLFAYALTPYAIYLILHFLQHPSYKKALVASATSCAVILISAHHTILLPILIVIFSLAFPEKKQCSKKQYVALLSPFFVVSITILAVVYANPASSLKTLSSQDFVVFTPHAICTKSLVLDTVFLASSWRNPLTTPLPCSNNTIFYASNVFLVGIMLLGAWRNKKLLAGAIILIILTNIPFIPAMRDSAKYLTDLALVEAILLAYGAIYIQKAIKSPIVPVIIILITILAGSSIFGGLSNTIIPKDYPASWYAFNQSLAGIREKPRVLFLPWHLYMPFDFTNNRTIANPANIFFTHADILQSNDAEIRVLDTTSLAELLQTHPAQYIALAHGSPEEELYKTALQQMPNLTKITDSPGLTVWKFEE